MAVTDKPTNNTAPTGGAAPSWKEKVNPKRIEKVLSLGFVEKEKQSGTFSRSWDDRENEISELLIKFGPSRNNKNGFPTGWLFVRMNGDDLVNYDDLVKDNIPVPQPILEYVIFSSQLAAEEKQPAPVTHEENVTGKPSEKPADKAPSGPSPTASTSAVPGAQTSPVKKQGGEGGSFSEPKPKAPAQAPPRASTSPAPAPQTPAQAPRNTSGILSRIKPVAEEVINLSIAVYGRSGSGKTRFSSTFLKRLLIIDIREHGTIGLKNIPGIDVLDIETWQEMVEAVEQLKKGHTYQTISIDTMTGLQDLATLEVLKKNKLGIADKVTLPMHGTIATMMNAMITDLATLAPTVLFICQEKRHKPDEEEHADQNIPEILPELKDKVERHLERTVSAMLQTYIKDVFDHDQEGKVITRPTYRLRVRSHSVYTIKIRQEVGTTIPEDIENPTYEKLMEIFPKSG